MSEVRVCEGLKIVNVNGYQFEKLRNSNDTFNFGAESILEGLSYLIEQLLANYEYDSQIPYQKLFYVVKQLVDSGAEDANVRNAIFTGLLSEHVKAPKEIVRKQPEEKPKEINVSALTLYAKTHSVQEVTVHFGFKDTKQCSNFMRYRNINWKKNENGNGKISMLDKNDEKIRKLAVSMRLCELSRTFGVGKTTMLNYLTTRNIEYKRGNNAKTNK